MIRQCGKRSSCNPTTVILSSNNARPVIGSRAKAASNSRENRWVAAPLMGGRCDDGRWPVRFCRARWKRGIAASSAVGPQGTVPAILGELPRPRSATVKWRFRFPRACSWSKISEEAPRPQGPNPTPVHIPHPSAFSCASLLPLRLCVKPLPARSFTRQPREHIPHPTSHIPLPPAFILRYSPPPHPPSNAGRSPAWPPRAATHPPAAPRASRAPARKG